MAIITRELIREGQSLAGGWNRKQVELLGLSWPPKHGWQHKLLGTEISEASAARFVALRGQTVRASKRHAMNELPLPPQIKPQIAHTLNHTFTWLKRLDPTDLKNSLPSLQYIVRACAQRVEGIEHTPPLAAFSDEIDEGNDEGGEAPWSPCQ